MRLIFIRHGDPDYEKDSLTEKGRREAALLCGRLLRLDIGDIYVSPLGRARDTLKPYLDRTGREAAVNLQCKEMGIPGVYLFTPRVFGDARGFFLQTWQKPEYEAAGLKREFVQDNLSRSRLGTVRGLHYQLKHPQAKLVSGAQPMPFSDSHI